MPTMKSANKDIWVFGYGSLMWRPNFPHTDTQPALLRGYHRALCLYSIGYRGTEECPGLVLGLDRGGSCRGQAMRVAGSDVEDVIAYLDRREMVHKAYKPSWLPVQLVEGRVTAYTFVVDRGHRQFTGRLPDAEIVRLVLQGKGKRGTCLEYLRNTVEHLDELGIRDGPVHRVLEMADAAKID